MNSVASEPALIGIDWGTSSLRAFLIGAGGEVLDQVSKPEGIMHVKDGDFEGSFRDLIGPWGNAAGLPVIASGMITSRNGWVETPYVSVPSGVNELAGALVPHKTSDGVTVTFVTGMTTDHDGAPDVMRGEETQIIGASALGMSDGTFVMPGTHSKWITVRSNLIDDYATFMTGEVFAAMRQHSILGTLMEEGPFQEGAFRKGCAAGLAEGSKLLHDLFGVRTLPLFGKIAGNMVEDYLSGLLIGAEIKGADVASIDGPVMIVGRDDLSDRYEIGLELAGLTSKRAPDDIVARGHFMIAQAAGLVS
ncbi:2-dehydro-3-deoxygalactonokinase [Pelagimonas varians]|uniref:2-keto-3-deoxy-galactonokinase n=1 Tax=Pelagimonas varians TaxID=696760 RepID=A0A238K970_9RHOB|nr:2-dehydro-3-deoxygalactonokinase [Pelagimonas varians]PYG31841.1 2-keto-3-deoxygalactonate kinase [Pelagimonas varians]SMX38516.1 2-keto-3-deoxy-galactonokinase [Pelagimonas varians]